MYEEGLERYELETIEIQNHFLKAMEGVELSSNDTAKELSLSPDSFEETVIRQAQRCYDEWMRERFDNFSCFQTVFH